MIAAFAEHLAGVRWRTLDEPARRWLQLCLLANLSVAIPGPRNTRLPEPAAAPGHLLFSGRHTASARDAAFWNAAAMHARTQDDFHPFGNLHLGTVVIPVVLAMAERHASSGERLLDAMAAGYAAAVGLSRSLSAHTTPRGLRSTGLYAPFGAAAAAALLADADTAQLGNALALVASLASGITQCWVDGSDEWQLHVAHAADAGILAIDLTQAGVHGGAHQLDGQAGFLRAFAGFVPSVDSVLADADASRAIRETVIKRYPVSGICQPVVLAAERIARRTPTRIGDITRARIEMTPFELGYPGTLNKGPFKSFSDVLMSAAFCMSSVLANGRLLFDDLMRFESVERNGLIDRTEVVPDEGLGTLSCRITLELANGTAIVEELRDGGHALALDWDSIDDWARALWREGGRSDAAYDRARAAVLDLPLRPAADLIAALGKDESTDPGRRVSTI